MLVDLEKLAEGYHISELASLANDLRICISTLGAVWTAEMKKKADHMVGKGPRERQSPVAEIRDTKDKRHQTENPRRPLTVECSAPPPVADRETDMSAYSEALSFLSSPLLPSQDTNHITRINNYMEAVVTRYFLFCPILFCRIEAIL